ncbi:Hypothetical protein CINCED_3A007893 [Cinara cedri]|uniref:Uncharacterized protein n=1 Tax=Cinara cedri TaxID=506608 RepID=A0A5E4MM73_9HEMI|nr:Hypothetical protein CINCED_3A007893 [Cinara cedri]
MNHLLVILHPTRLISPLVLDQNYVQKKTQVIKAERRVLKELGFCVHVKHPHKLIVMYLQALGFEKHQSIMQMSWNYMNDSLQTDVFVQYDPETIACACIYLSARKLHIPLPKSPAWYSLFNANEMDIQDICRKILKLYLRAKVITEDLEKRVEELKKEYDHAREKAKATIVANTMQINVVTPPTSNGTTVIVQENIDSTTPNKKPIKKRSRSRTPSETKSGSRSPRHLKKSKKRNHDRSRSKSLSDRRSHKHHRKSNKGRKRYSSSSSASSSSSDYRRHKSKLVNTFRDYKDKDYKEYRDYRGEENYKSKSRSYNYWKKFYGE